jgi:hypothetical protein
MVRRHLAEHLSITSGLRKPCPDAGLRFSPTLSTAPPTSKRKARGVKATKRLTKTVTTTQLLMPTASTPRNGGQVHQDTKISVSRCAMVKRWMGRRRRRRRRAGEKKGGGTDDSQTRDSVSDFSRKSSQHG